MIWSELLEQLSTGQTFLISSHLSPDGDCIGSQLAMMWYLESIGKTVTVYNHDALPSKFAFLKDSNKISHEQPAGHFDTVLVLDCSNLRRLGWDTIGDSADRIINIDHHRDNTRFGNCNVVEKSAATGELIYWFFAAMSIDFPKHVAEDLYAAVLTDTGGFRFSNTDQGILRLCADLAAKGANCSEIYENVYASHTHAGLMLRSRIWSTLSYHCDNRICTMELPLSLIDKLGAFYSDSEGMADQTITVHGVEVGVFIKHTPEQTHFSLRSKGLIDVGKIAKMVPGGGGHSNAAGCTIEASISTALPAMLALLEKELDVTGKRVPLH